MVVVIVVAVLYLVGPRLGRIVTLPSPAPPAAEGAAPTVGPMIDSTPAPTTAAVAAPISYVSSRFDYVAFYAGNWTMEPAEEDWAATLIVPTARGLNADFFTMPDRQAWIFVSSREIAAAETAESLGAAIREAREKSCDRTNMAAVTVDGASATIDDLFCDSPAQHGLRMDRYFEIVTEHAHRMYFIDFMSPDLRPVDAADRDAFLAFVATFRFAGS